MPRPCVPWFRQYSKDSCKLCVIDVQDVSQGRLVIDVQNVLQGRWVFDVQNVLQDIEWLLYRMCHKGF
jgi:hypothetical protein